jgi:hypothetical protein
VAATVRPPANEIPGTAALSLLLARTDDLAVALIGLRAYSTGLLFDLAVRLRTPDRLDREGGPLYQVVAGPFRGEHAFLLGFEYPDGRTATNLRWDFRPPFDAADDPQLLPSGGGGGGDQTFDAGYFLSPLRTGGDLTVVCAWPSRGIPETQSVRAGELISDAASRITELWPWEDLPDETPAAPHSTPARPAPRQLVRRHPGAPTNHACPTPRTGERQPEALVRPRTKVPLKGA